MRCVYFGQSLLAIATFSILFVPPGFVAGYLTNVAGFRRQSPSERLLWSISLSYPLATVLAAAGGVYVGTPVLAAILGILAIISLLLAASLAKRDGFRRYTRPSREAKIIASSLAVLVVYIIMISVPIIIGTSLYEGTSNMDWRIRVPQSERPFVAVCLPSIHSARSGELPPFVTITTGFLSAGWPESSVICRRGRS